MFFEFLSDLPTKSTKVASFVLPVYLKQRFSENKENWFSRNDVLSHERGLV